jgi:hypothetical protein
MWATSVIFKSIQPPNFDSDQLYTYGGLVDKTWISCVQFNLFNVHNTYVHACREFIIDNGRTWKQFQDLQQKLYFTFPFSRCVVDTKLMMVYRDDSSAILNSWTLFMLSVLNFLQLNEGVSSPGFKGVHG